jgi:hypothetical protein
MGRRRGQRAEGRICNFMFVGVFSALFPM